MNRVQAFLDRNRWLYLLLLNVFFSGSLFLFLALSIAVGVGESYHPDSYERSLVPLMLALAGATALGLVLSFVCWIRWRKITAQRAFQMVGLYFVILVFAGITAYYATPEKPDYRTYEFRDATYMIPVAYSPNAYNGSLHIEACSQNTSVGRYEYSFFDEINSQCEAVQVVIEPAENISQSFFGISMRIYFLVNMVLPLQHLHLFCSSSRHLMRACLS